MKKIAKKIIVLFLYYSGLNRLIGIFLRKKIFCVGYHSVSDKKSPLYSDISVSQNDFEKQILFLKNNNHTFIHFSDLKKEKTKKVSKPTVIFFDDGFKDVLTNALPILKKYNIPATIFITTGLVDKTDFLWTVGLRYFLTQKGCGQEDISEEVSKYKKMTMVERKEKLKNLFSENNFALNPKDFDIFLDWQEVKMLSDNNFEVGSHGLNHQKFNELEEEVLKMEMSDSKKILEEKIGKKVEVISYPYGRYNETVVDCAKSAGYLLGMSTISGFNSFDYIEKYPFQIKRINPEQSRDFTSFKVKLYCNI